MYERELAVLASDHRTEEWLQQLEVSLADLANPGLEFTLIINRIDQAITEYDNLVWIQEHFEQFRTDPVFYHTLGKTLRAQGYTTSEEVAGGISTTMSTAWDKLIEFYQELVKYINTVLSVNLQGVAELCRKLAEEYNEPAKVDKAKKAYTTHGESVTTLIQLFEEIRTESNALPKTIDSISGLSDAEKVEAEGQKVTAKSESTALDEIIQQLNTESGNGADRSNTQDGTDPITGRWFDATALTQLADAVSLLASFQRAVSNMQSSVDRMASNAKSDTQVSASLVKIKLDTAKQCTKDIDQLVKVMTRYASRIGKRCQTILTRLK